MYFLLFTVHIALKVISTLWFTNTIVWNQVSIWEWCFKIIYVLLWLYLTYLSWLVLSLTFFSVPTKYTATVAGLGIFLLNSQKFVALFQQNAYLKHCSPPQTPSVSSYIKSSWTDMDENRQFSVTKQKTTRCLLFCFFFYKYCHRLYIPVKWKKKNPKTEKNNNRIMTCMKGTSSECFFFLGEVYHYVANCAQHFLHINARNLRLDQYLQTVLETDKSPAFKEQSQMPSPNTVKYKVPGSMNVCKIVQHGLRNTYKNHCHFTQFSTIFTKISLAKSILYININILLQCFWKRNKNHIYCKCFWKRNFGASTATFP